MIINSKKHEHDNYLILIVSFRCEKTNSKSKENGQPTGASDFSREL